MSWCDPSFLKMNGPVILSDILITIWWMNIKLLYNESVWCKGWPKINQGHSHLYFMVQWFCLISLRPFYGWTSNFWLMSQCDATFDLKIKVGHNDLYFMVQWFCLISWRLFDGWLSKFWIMSLCDRSFDLRMNVGHSDPLFHGPVILSDILKTIW